MPRVTFYPMKKPFPNRKPIVCSAYELLSLTQFIFGLYSDTENVVQKLLFNAVEVTEPDIEIYDEVNEAHRIWAVINEEAIQTIVNFM